MASKKEQQRRSGSKHQYNSTKGRAEKEASGFGPNAIKIPQGFSQFKFKRAGLYRLRILPFLTSNRDIDHSLCDPGFLDYVYKYWTHTNIGSDPKQHWCCLNRTFHEACSVCEARGRLEFPYGRDKEIAKNLNIKDRNLFALYDLDEMSKGIQILETYVNTGPDMMSLGKAITNKVRAKPTKYENFWHLEGGMVLEVTTGQDAYMGSPTFPITDLEFTEDGAEDLPDSLLDEVPQLDTLPIKLSYEELKRVFDGGRVPGGTEQEEQEEEDRPSRSKVSVSHRPSRDEEEEEEESRSSHNGRDGDEEEEEEEAPRAKAKPKLAAGTGKKASRVVEDEDEDPDEDFDEEEQEDEDEPEDEDE